MLKTKQEQRKYWEKYAQQRLVGKTVKANSYLSKEELKELGWYSNSTLCIEFEGGATIFPSADDEGNDGGFFSFQSRAKTKYSIVGAKVVRAFYMSDEDMQKHGWYKRPLCLRLEHPMIGTIFVITQCDPEGNDGGAIFGGDGKEQWTFPVID